MKASLSVHKYHDSRLWLHLYSHLYLDLSNNQAAADTPRLVPWYTNHYWFNANLYTPNQTQNKSWHQHSQRLTYELISGGPWDQSVKSRSSRRQHVIFKTQSLTHRCVTAGCCPRCYVIAPLYTQPPSYTTKCLPGVRYVIFYVKRKNVILRYSEQIFPSTPIQGRTRDA